MAPQNSALTILAFTCLHLVAVACGGSPTAPSTSSTSSAPTQTLTVSGPQGILIPGETVQLQAIEHYYPAGNQADRTPTAMWRSSNTVIAIVSSEGLVTATAPGAADISATFENLTTTTGIRVATSHALFSGQIDPDVAADIIAYNQNPGGSFNRYPGIINRFDLPIRVYVDPAFARAFADCAQRAITAWQAGTGLPVTYIDQDAEPRVRWIVQPIADGHPYTRVESVNLDNSYRSVVVVLPTGMAPRPDLPGNCPDPVLDTATHEFGHGQGIIQHPPWGGVMEYRETWTGLRQPNAREFRMITELYKLPLGAHVNPDGSWVVR